MFHWSIEFQGSCSTDLKLGQSENSIFGIYDQLAFCQYLTLASTDLSMEVKACFSSCLIEKNVKVNIMLFRTLCSVEFQGSCSKNLNIRLSQNCVFGINAQ
jgi:hypothetical protein